MKTLFFSSVLNPIRLELLQQLPTEYIYRLGLFRDWLLMFRISDNQIGQSISKILKNSKKT